MSSVVQVVLGSIVGFGLGLVFFGTLWVTVRQLPGARRPGLLAAVSFIIRLAVLAGGLLLLALWGWVPLVAGGVGVIVARTVLVRRLGLPDRDRLIRELTGGE